MKFRFLDDSGKLKVASFYGIPLLLHWSWFMLIAWVTLAAGPADFFLVLLLFLIVVLHEYGHCYMARRLNVPVKDVTLWPLGGLAHMDSIGKNPREEYLIAIAGPAVNVVLSVVFMLAWFVAWGFHPPSAVKMELDFSWNVLYVFATMNMYLAFFNLLPVFPMDGGRVLRAYLVNKMRSFKVGTMTAARIAQFGCLLFLMFGFLSGNMMLLFIAVFIGLAAQGQIMEFGLARSKIQKRVAKELGIEQLANLDFGEIIPVLLAVKCDVPLREKIIPVLAGAITEMVMAEEKTSYPESAAEVIVPRGVSPKTEEQEEVEDAAEEMDEAVAYDIYTAIANAVPSYQETISENEVTFTSCGEEEDK